MSESVLDHKKIEYLQPGLYPLHFLYSFFSLAPEGFSHRTEKYAKFSQWLNTLDSQHS